ncbi:MAG: calcium-translocating P-type ATPase, PMCA-type [Firmicutes bacterium]|nr:calcium-translocating P-type ATPase, PMCA-type [Bacillota bacterium]
MYFEKTIRETEEILKTDMDTGLSEEEAKRRLEKYGENRLEQQKEKPILLKLAYQFSDPMVIILIVAAVISFVTEWLNGTADFVDPAIIMAIVFLNAGIGVFQELKAEKALEALKEMLSPEALVRRNGKAVKVPAEQLVPGDILIIETGDIIPADCRLIRSIELSVEESSLTGESHGVHKDAAAVFEEGTPLGDRKNMVWSATMVSAGRGEGIVTATGMQTEVGKIAGILISEAVPQTPLQQKLAKTGQSLGLAALCVCGVIFVFGLLRAMPPMDIFLTAVSLAVAAIPEGLPAIVTIMLAIGVQKMADNRAIIRKLSAVETLGSASVICSDKTGTITQNKMQVKEWWSVSDNVYLYAALCNNDMGQTEGALVRGASEKGFLKAEWEERYPRIMEEPFDSVKKWMGTVHRFPSGSRTIVKGAPDIIVEKCRISDEEKNRVLKKNKEMASKALRVIAFAEGEGICFDELRFAGLAGIYDPPRPEAKAAVETCRKAGIKVVMITGDHEETAAAVAEEAGIAERTGEKISLSGKELDAMPDEQLLRNIERYSVFARVTPKDKVRIVKAFQRKGHIVAMTGDGVNDAPALKAADIGCAMGIGGTAVARGAADMVLADDNFATIVTAVKEGRGIYDNIRKAVHFLLSSNIGEIITIFVAILLGWNTPLLPVQLLWINLITDSFPAIALGVDPADPDIMNRRPVKREKSLFADGMTANILIEGVMIGTLALFAFAIGYNAYGSLDIGRTLAFTVLGMSQLIHAFNMRSEDKSVFSLGIFSNMYLTGAFFICFALQVAVVSLPVMADIFKVVPLDGTQWLIAGALSLFPLLFVELEKLILRREIPRRPR